MNNQVIIYQTKDGKTHIDVKVDGETVWLSLLQMVELFERDKSVISRHLNNIFKEGELEKNATVAKFATVQLEGTRQVSREIEFFNLDAIISVGYRVNSKNGVRFRQWATQKLKDYLVQGYSLNHQKITQKGVDEIQRTLALLSKTLQKQELFDEKGIEMLLMVESYAKTWHLLFKYDENELEIPTNSTPATSLLPYEEVLDAINNLKTQLSQCEEATSLFGQQYDQRLIGILGNIEQTFEGAPLYPSREEKAAHLLYFVIKDHPFSDGNKRIGVLLFLLYLKKQGVTLGSLSDIALVSLALMIAESDPSHKDTVIRLIINMLAS